MAAVVSTMELRKRARLYLERVYERCGCTASLAVLDVPDVVYIDCIPRSGSQTGCSDDLGAASRLPAYCTATGKMLLTYLPADERRQLVDGLDLHEHTSQTFTDRKAFSEELAEIRAAHFAINDEEFIEGVVGLAVPVRDVSEAVVAALGAAAHTSECSADELIVRALPCLRQAGQEISIDLGYRVHRNE